MTKLTFISLKDFHNTIYPKLKQEPTNEEIIAESKPRIKIFTYFSTSFIIHLLIFIFTYLQVKSTGIEVVDTKSLYIVVFLANFTILFLLFRSEKYSFIIHNLITLQITNILSGILCIAGFKALVNAHWIEFIYPFIYPSFTILIVLIFILIALEILIWLVEKFIFNLK